MEMREIVAARVPAHVRIDYRANVADEEFGWEVTDLTPAPN